MNNIKFSVLTAIHSNPTVSLGALYIVCKDWVLFVRFSNIRC